MSCRYFQIYVANSIINSNQGLTFLTDCGMNNMILLLKFWGTFLWSAKMVKSVSGSKESLLLWVEQVPRQQPCN